MGIEEQSNTKEMIDARTFPEIYNSLNKLQQKELSDEIIHKTGVSRQSVWYWAKGDRIPQYSGVRNLVADCVRKIVGVKVPQHILFDVKK